MTAVVGVLLGLATLIAEDQGFPSVGVNGAIDSPFIVVAAVGFFAAPLAVGRWWAVFSMAGPALALLILQVANVPVTLDDGTGEAINYRTIFQFIVFSAAVLIVIGVRSLLVAAQSDQPG